MRARPSPPFDNSARPVLNSERPSWAQAFSPFGGRLSSGLVQIVILMTASGCAVRRTTVVPRSQTPPAKEASARELVDRVNKTSAAIRTLSAQVDLAPTAGSVYSGMITEYRDVKGFILYQKPATIRIIGQAPVVRTTIFDMVSEGNQFRLYIPSKEQFIVGENTCRRPAKNTLESMRPQHILDALLIPRIDPPREYYTVLETTDAGRPYYLVGVLAPASGGAPGELVLKRRLWFDRSTLDVSRLEIYGPAGKQVEDVRYSEYKDFGGIRYPSSLRIDRPEDGYRLAITVEKASFNQPLAAEKFKLEKPESAKIVRLDEEGKRPAPPAGEHSRDE